MATRWTAHPDRVRVQLHPAHDLWMRGARYGTVEAFRKINTRTQYRVKMDHAQVKQPVVVWADDCTYV